ncbi:MAG TPA: hypothetical protein VLB67_09415 [Acidimicrobiia bacterium]|nr:hypothetical protein [Acidimicrobiia bacterium]
MSVEEKSTWTTGLVQLAVGLWYTVTILRKAATTPVADIDYRGELVALVIAVVALTIVGAIVVGIGSAGWAVARGRPVDDDRIDERDRSIGRFAGNVGGVVLAVGMVPALGLAVFEFHHFWIVHAMLAAFFASEMTQSAVKIVAYRRGL